MKQCRTDQRKLVYQNQLDSFGRFDRTPTSGRHRHAERDTRSQLVRREHTASRGNETDRSTLMAVRLRMDAVQLMTSHAIQVSHSRSPRPQSPLLTCIV